LEGRKRIFDGKGPKRPVLGEKGGFRSEEIEKKSSQTTHGLANGTPEEKAADVPKGDGKGSSSERSPFGRGEIPPGKKRLFNLGKKEPNFIVGRRKKGAQSICRESGKAGRGEIKALPLSCKGRISEIVRRRGGEKKVPLLSSKRRVEKAGGSDLQAGGGLLGRGRWVKSGKAPLRRKAALPPEGAGEERERF